MKNRLTEEDIDAIQAQCREIGVGICRERLRDKLWMLYGFLLKEGLGKAE